MISILTEMVWVAQGVGTIRCCAHQRRRADGEGEGVPMRSGASSLLERSGLFITDFTSYNRLYQVEWWA